MTILAVTDATFQNAVTEASNTRPIMVVFTLVDSEPCQEVRPLVEAIATTHSDSLTVVQIDADANPDSVAVFGIQLVPAIRMVRFGILQAALDGSTTQDELQQCVATTLAATRLAVLDKTDESALRAIIAETPFDVPATLALGELLLDRGEYEQAAVLLMTVGSHSAVASTSALDCLATRRPTPNFAPASNATTTPKAVSMGCSPCSPRRIRNGKT